MKPLTSAAYWREIESLAKSVCEGAWDYGSDPYDTLHEIIDGHQWIIYTYYHLDILRHTDNNDALFDSGGSLDGVQSWDQATAALCYHAMFADVTQHTSWDPEES